MTGFMEQVGPILQILDENKMNLKLLLRNSTKVYICFGSWMIKRERKGMLAEIYIIFIHSKSKLLLLLHDEYNTFWDVRQQELK